MSEKTEDQIAKDKEAVAKMAGAKSAMEAALRRIETLERTLVSVKRQSEAIGRAFNDEVYLRIYTGNNSGGYETIKVKKLFEEIDNTIKAVL